MTVNDLEKDMAAAYAEAGEHGTAKQMASGSSTRQKHEGTAKKKPYLAALIFGIISISAYVLLFKNENWVTETYTMGGWHTIFPVGTAFFFSFIHGAFASNLLSVIGIEAKK